MNKIRPMLELNYKNASLNRIRQGTLSSLCKIPIGEVLKVITTKTGASAVIAALSRETGNQLIDQIDYDGEKFFYIKRMR